MKKLLFLIYIFSTFKSSKAQIMPRLVLPVGHTSVLHSAKFSHDSKYVVTSSSDFTAKIWDVASGKELLSFRGCKGPIYSASFSPNDKYVLTASDDNTARIWDSKTGKNIIIIKNKESVTNAIFNSIGDNIMTISQWDNSARIFDVLTGKELKHFSGVVGTKGSAEFSIDGRYIVLASVDSTAIIIEANTGKESHRLIGHTGDISSVHFSFDSKYVVTTSLDSTSRVYEVNTGKELFHLIGHNGIVINAAFSPNNKYLVTSSNDNTSRIWEIATGKELHTLRGHRDCVSSALFSPDGKFIVTTSWDKTSKIWDVSSGKELFKLNGHSSLVNSASFSLDGKYVVTDSWDSTAIIYEVKTGIQKQILTGNTSYVNSSVINKTGDNILSPSLDNTTSIWDLYTSRELFTLNGHKSNVYNAVYSNDNKYIATCAFDSTVKIWDAKSGKIIQTINCGDKNVYQVEFNESGNLLITRSSDSNNVKIWDILKGVQIYKINNYSFFYPDISPNGNYLVTVYKDGSAKIWDVNYRKLLCSLLGHTDEINIAKFDFSGKYLATGSDDSTVIIWDLLSGKKIKSFKFNNRVFSISFSPDNKYLGIIPTSSEIVEIVDMSTFKEYKKIQINSTWGSFVNFSPDSKFITIKDEEKIDIYDVESGLIKKSLLGHLGGVRSTIFSPNSKYIITNGNDNKTIVWDCINGRRLYTRLKLKNGDWLVYDTSYHFDGTPGAMEKLYFVCGLEVIELNQLKNSLWVPNLAKRIMNGEKINSTKLSDLEICDFIPIVERQKDSDLYYSYLITPRRGGLGNVIVSMNNGAYTKTYKSNQLIESGTNFILNIPKSEIKQYFKIGESNTIVVTAKTSDNEISSRGDKITVEENDVSSVVPNIYGVFVGVSDYKGEGIDLKYAAKDAEDLASVFDVSAKELIKKIESDTSQKHVFMYKINTGDKRTAFPDKNTIRETLLEIGKKTKPNDILMIFFSGHGVMQGEAKKTFYFLTADASSTNEPASSVGISTGELAEWLKPENNKAQKRILIFDACHSGQAINNFVKLGDGAQNYTASKGEDDEGQRIKNIDKLNEQTGFFILSAAASGQSAYELSRYSQGLLTYSLLKTMKQDPSILDNKNQLDVSKWFNASQEMVKEEIRKQNISNPQEPQIVSSNSFKIGLVNDAVYNAIHLANEKPMFTRSDFRNTALPLDNIKLRNLIDNEINEISERGNYSGIAFSSDYQGADAYTLSGDYTIKGKRIKVSVFLIKGGTEPIINFTVGGSIDDLKKVSEEIVNQALGKLSSKID